MYSHVACDVMKERTLYLLKPSSLIWHLMPYLFGTRDPFNISYSRELLLFSKFLHFEEIVRVKIAVCFEMIVSET